MLGEIIEKKVVAPIDPNATDGLCILGIIIFPVIRNHASTYLGYEETSAPIVKLCLLITRLQSAAHGFLLFSTVKFRNERVRQENVN